MNEYLQVNLNQELLRAAGETLKGISPESECYAKIADRLLRLNEKTRVIMAERDNMEFEQLLKLNSLPKSDCESLRQMALQNLNLRQERYSKFLADYNTFYREQLSRS